MTHENDYVPLIGKIFRNVHGERIIPTDLNFLSTHHENLIKDLSAKKAGKSNLNAIVLLLRYTHSEKHHDDIDLYNHFLKQAIGVYISMKNNTIKTSYEKRTHYDVTEF